MMTPQNISSWQEGPCGSARILLLALGNLTLRDDGVGIHALRRLIPLVPADCLVADAGTPEPVASYLLERADKIIAFDALVAGRSPGTVYALRTDEVQGEGGDDALEYVGIPWSLRSLKNCSAEVVVIAAEPKVIAFGIGLSPQLESAVSIMVEAALTLISMWHGDHSPEVRSSRTDLSGVLSTSPHYRNLLIPRAV